MLALGALALDLLRLRERRVRRLFRDFLGGMLREHEQFGLLGSTYLLMAALLAVDLFPRPVAAAALGFTVLGDAFAAIVGKAWGRTRVFGKTLEGALGGLAACLAWAAFLAAFGYLPWGVVVAGALVASLAEILPIPLDDNLGMTLLAGVVMRPALEPLVIRPSPRPGNEFDGALAGGPRGPLRAGDRADRARAGARAPRDLAAHRRGRGPGEGGAAGRGGRRPGGGRGGARGGAAPAARLPGPVAPPGAPAARAAAPAPRRAGRSTGRWR